MAIFIKFEAPNIWSLNEMNSSRKFNLIQQNIVSRLCRTDECKIEMEKIQGFSVSRSEK